MSEQIKPVAKFLQSQTGGFSFGQIIPDGNHRFTAGEPLYSQSTVDALTARIAELEKSASQYRIEGMEMARQVCIGMKKKCSDINEVPASLSAYTCELRIDKLIKQERKK